MKIMRMVINVNLMIIIIMMTTRKRKKREEVEKITFYVVFGSIGLCMGITVLERESESGTRSVGDNE